MRIYTKNTYYNTLSDNLIYQNYHKHSMYTNVLIVDSATYPEEYAQRAVELGHGIISSCEHGYQGRYIESFEMAEKYNLKFLFAVEAYFVYDRFEKDNTNAHMVLMAKNENGRKAINRILSQANLDGFYYRARIDYDLLMTLPEDDVWLSSACIGGINKYTSDNLKSGKLLESWHNNSQYESPYEMLVDQIHQKFGDNFYLEVQAHNTIPQAEANKKMIEFSKKYNIEIIAGVDSHYIYPEDAWKRDYLQKSSGIFMEDEQGWFLDYPDGNTLFHRFQTQKVLTDDEIKVAISNTNIFLEVEEYTSPIFNHEMKMPSAPKYQNMTDEEKQIALIKIVRNRWDEIKHEIPEEKHSYYLREIAKELDIIFKIKHADYFLLNYEIIKDAVENRGGMITFSGRGSGPSFYVNHLLGFTQIDRISSPITLYPERFLSTSRMTAGSLADIDFNCGNTPVFEGSQEDILGEGHADPMIAYGTMKPKAAWKMYCRAVDVPFELANEISAKIDDYESDLKYWDEESGEEEPNVLDYIPEDLQEYFLKSKEFLGLTISGSRHPCFIGETLVNTEQGYKQIKDIQVGEKVLSHDGKYHEVLETMISESDDLYELKTGACEKIIGTGNHPFYTRKKIGWNYKTKTVEYTEPEWKNLKDLTLEDRIGIPVNNNSIIPKYEGLNHLMDNKDFWWFIGRYIGDGWCTCGKYNSNGYNKLDRRVILCCDRTDEQELIDIKNKINNIFNYSVSISKSTYNIRIKDNEILYNFLQLFGKYADKKHLTKMIIDLPPDLLKSFLDGYFSADGYFNKKLNLQTFITVSENLAYDLMQCIYKVYKKSCYMYIRQAHESMCEGRKIFTKKAYECGFTPHYRKKNKGKSFYEYGYMWVKVSSLIKNNNQMNVYNLAVNETNTYNVYNHIVHNCGNILLTQDIREEVGIVRLKSKGGRETICAVLDGKWCEKYLMLKNDLLTVTCVRLVYDLYKRVGLPYMSLNKLLEEVKLHPEVWNMYEKGYVVGLNQVERNSTKRKVMKYKPKNISELSAFIAGIRPAFKSLVDKLINREHFEYGIPTLDNLLQTEELPESFILYQEQIMKILAFAGIPMGDCYTVIKSISKKRFEKIMHYKEQFLTGMAQKLIEAENINQTRAEEVAKTIWGIIEDASAYGFNSSHSLSVSFDSLLAAYFKALYPLEFYEVYLNLQMEKSKKDKAFLAQQEMKEAFNIKLLPMRFGQDNRKYTAYPEQNAVSTCMKSIKGFGDIVGEELFRLARHKYDTFLDLLIAMEYYVDLYPLEVWNDYISNNIIDENISNEIIKWINYYLENKDNPDVLIKKKPVTLDNVFSLSEIEGLNEYFAQSKPLWKIKVNGTQVETLIRLNYFEQYGRNNKLLQIFKLFNDYYGRKTLNKNKISNSGVDMNVLEKYIGKETEAQYSQIDFKGYINEISQNIEDKFIPLPEQLKFERELFEIPIYQNSEMPNTWNYIMGFKTYGDKINTPYLILYNLHSGELSKCQINSSALFRNNPFGIYSIIDAKKIEPVFKKKKLDNGKYVLTNETKDILKEYDVIIRDKNAEINEVLNDGR